MVLVNYHNLKNKNNWLIFLLLTLFFHSLTKKYNKCNDPSLINYLLLLLHDSVFVYFVFGSLIFGNHLIHTIFLLLTLLNWYILGKCIITIINNYSCKNDYDTKYFNIVTVLTNNNVMFIYIFSFLAIVYNLFNLYYN